MYAAIAIIEVVATSKLRLITPGFSMTSTISTDCSVRFNYAADIY